MDINDNKTLWQNWWHSLCHWGQIKLEGVTCIDQMPYSSHSDSIAMNIITSDLPGLLGIIIISLHSMCNVIGWFRNKYHLK